MSDGAIRRLLGYVRRYADSDAGPASDACLLGRYVADGDEAAFELLVWRHAGLVFGVCRRVLGDSHAAEDAFQATFLALARKARAIRRGESLAGWLHRVARRIASRARHSTARRILVERRAAVGVDLTIAECNLGDVRAVVDEEVDRLPERLRRAVVLCYLEGLTTDEAARRLGCPRGTVLSRLSAARERLRGRLTKRGLGLPAAGVAAVFVPTTAPASLVVPAVRASLAFAAGTVAAAEVAPRVIGWADGVIRAMMLTKLKFAAGIVLAAGMLGGGGAWIAGPGGGPAIAFAGVPKHVQGGENKQRQQSEAQEKQGPVTDQSQKHEEVLKLLLTSRETMRAEVTHQEKESADFEDQSSRSMIGTRLKFMAAEDRLKQLLRQRDGAPDDKVILSLEQQLLDAQGKLEELAATHGKNHPNALIAEKRVETIKDYLKAFRPKPSAQLEKELAEARREFVEAEVEFRGSERQLELWRSRKQKRLEAAYEHLRLLDRKILEMTVPAPTGAPAGGDLERKLDDLIREVRELRREMKK